MLAVLGGVFFSSPAQAFVFDLATMQLDALDFADKLLNFLYNIVLVLISAIVLLNVAAGVLDVVLAIPIQIAGNSLVTEGWTFMVGLSNTFIVLAILAIAIAYILRIESFQAKKMLPKLIIVALLINFSLVLVSGLVDITSFFHNTVLQALSVNSIQDAIQPIIDQMIAFIPWYLGILIGYQVAALIPYANVVALVVVVILLMYDFLAGSFVQFLIMALISASFVSVLGFLIFLFLARVVMVWILAIFAPIAIVTSVLPPIKRVTGKISFLNFEGWFQSLLEWLFLGEIILFLLALGLRFVSAVESALGGAPANIPINTGVGIYNFPGGLINYFFLLVYIILVSHFAQKAAPELAGVIQGQLKAGVKGFTRPSGAARLSRAQRQRSWDQTKAGAKRAAGWAAEKGASIIPSERLKARAIEYSEKTRKDWKRAVKEAPSDIKDWKPELQEEYLENASEGRMLSAAQKMNAEQLSHILEKNKTVRNKLLRAANDKAGKKTYENEIKAVYKAMPEQFGSETTEKFMGREQWESKERARENIKEETKELKERKGEEFEGAVRKELGKGEKEQLTEKDWEEFATRVFNFRKYADPEITSKSSLKSVVAQVASHKMKADFFKKAYDKLGAEDFYEGLYGSGEGKGAAAGVGNMSGEELAKKSPALVRALTFDRKMQEIGHQDTYKFKDNVYEFIDQVEMEKEAKERGRVAVFSEELESLEERKKRLESQPKTKSRQKKIDILDARIKDVQKKTTQGLEKDWEELNERKQGLVKDEDIKKRAEVIWSKRESGMNVGGYTPKQVQRMQEAAGVNEGDFNFYLATKQLVSERQSMLEEKPLLSKIKEAEKKGASKKEIKKMQKEFKNLPEPVQRAERIFSAYSQGLKSAEKEKELFEVERNKLIEAGSTLNDPKVKDLDKKIGARQKRIDAFSSHRQQALDQWKSHMGNMVHGQIENIYARDTAMLRKAEEEIMGEIAELEKLGEEPEKIKALKSASQSIKENRESSERQLAINIRLNQIKERLPNLKENQKKELRKEAVQLATIGYKIRKGRNLDKKEEKEIRKITTSTKDRIQEDVSQWAGEWTEKRREEINSVKEFFSKHKPSIKKPHISWGSYGKRKATEFKEQYGRKKTKIRREMEEKIKKEKETLEEEQE